jgi:hypothetical protein
MTLSRRWALAAVTVAAFAVVASHPWVTQGQSASAITSCPLGQSVRAVSGGNVSCNVQPIRSVFNNTGVQLDQPDTSLRRVATLPLAAGKYLIIAKAIASPPGAGNPLNRGVQCRLNAEGDFDVAMAVTDSTIANATMALTVVHSFASSGQATLDCGFTGNGTNVKRVSWIKITAIRGGQITNSPTA